MNPHPAYTASDVAHLAYLNWEHDGCPSGRALDYWLEAECQIKATWHLLLAADAAVNAAEALTETRLREVALVFAAPELQPAPMSARPRQKFSPV